MFPLRQRFQAFSAASLRADTGCRNQRLSAVQDSLRLELIVELIRLQRQHPLSRLRNDISESNRQRDYG